MSKRSTTASLITICCLRWRSLSLWLCNIASYASNGRQRCHFGVASVSASFRQLLILTGIPDLPCGRSRIRHRNLDSRRLASWTSRRCRMAPVVPLDPPIDSRESAGGTSHGPQPTLLSSYTHSQCSVAQTVDPESPWFATSREIFAKMPTTVLGISAGRFYGRTSGDSARCCTSMRYLLCGGPASDLESVPLRSTLR